MVFVEYVITWTLCTLIMLAFFSLIFIIIFSLKDKITIYAKFNELIFVFLIIAVISGYYSIILLSIFLFILRNVKQPIHLSLIMEQQLINLPFTYRVLILAKVLKDSCIITLRTFPRYVWYIVYGGIVNLKELFYDTINDIQIGFFLKEPVKKTLPRDIDWYLLKLKYFKYNKLPLKKLSSEYTEDELIEIQKFWDKTKNIKFNFGMFRHMPIKLENTVDETIYFKLITSNILVFYNFIKTTLISLILMSLYFLYTIFFFKIQFLKQLSVWFVIGMLYFWLMSGFNFFLKRYQFGKFTSQIQRFWKRTLTSFWLIEGFLILIFFYYFLNSSQEPMYMYDYSSLNQEYLVSLQTAALNIILLSFVIYFMYFTMLRINTNSWQQLSLYLAVISSFIFFSFFIETYQFYYVISTFNERLWIFNEEENLWSIDIESPIHRAKQNYLLACLIAKYWHFLFIFLSWVFFIIKSLEKKKITYVLFGANLQNIIILYILNFACYLQWAKWVYRRFFDLPYTWFMTSIDNKFMTRLMSEINLLLSNLFVSNITISKFTNLVYRSTILWNVDSLAYWKFL